MRHQTLLEAATKVVSRLREAGFVALFAGGCVRDMLLDREPKDFDVATDARPEQIQGLFRRTMSVGAKFGVVIVKQGKHWIEVATFRTDCSYADGRHPDQVVFGSAEADAERRDFTINGMFYDPIDKRVIDYVDGEADLNARIIRAIGDPRRRFAEDHLRLLRAVRFAATYEFEIEPATFAAVRANAVLLPNVSAERIREELERMLSDEHRGRAMRLMSDAGLLPHLWADATWSQRQACDGEGILRLLPADASFEAAMAGVLIDRSAKKVSRICRSITCSNRVRETIVWLVAHVGDLATPDRLTLADLKRLMAHEAFDELLALLRALRTHRGESLDPHAEISRRAAEIPGDAVAPPPLIGGDDLMALGVDPGPTYKRVLDAVYTAQLNEEISTQRQALALARAKLDALGVRISDD